MLISYMEDRNEVYWHGYLYAAGLFGSTLIASLLTAHFDYYIKKIQVKLTSGQSIYTHLSSVYTDGERKYCPFTFTFFEPSKMQRLEEDMSFLFYGICAEIHVHISELHVHISELHVHISELHVHISELHVHISEITAYFQQSLPVSTRGCSALTL